ncbi:DNA-binding protein [Clostridium neonatale]|uniref:helix-turn-helix domain-containing protein n=1 Tax=Clostridium neonatale TaxID=137838 RepID=UPI00291BD253|nr:DNA-binding protein [Clostridium neonatale]CAI3550071.1 DNA-binding protein [Clostridium neonatale]CAI3552376.1 DNA-binding protein [Clostridium neonatale]CAI3552614.1 DNA-binding protein [Clostridium neonatale]CAI3609574.1 DNA-binding protein [Clostridium neonatale]
MANKTLTDKQIQAIELIAQGENISDTAKLIGVSRTTVSIWKNNNELFKAELDKSLQALKSDSDTQILSNINSLTNRLIKIALKSNSDKTSLDAIIYALNRVLGTPTNKVQDISSTSNDNNEPVDINAILEEIKRENNVIDLPKKVGK